MENCGSIALEDIPVLRKFLFTSSLALLSGSAIAPPPATAAQPAKIEKPRPAPAPTTAFPALPTAQQDSTLVIGGDSIAAKKVDSRLLVNVSINGSGPYKFVVDSGADTSVVGLRLANNLQLPLTTPTTLNSTTAREIVDRVKVDSLSFGQSTVRDLELPALRESNVGSDGLIGIDALVNQRLMLDFTKRQIKVEDARKPERHEPGEIVITARRRRGQLILTQVTAAGFSLDAVIDTGSQVTIGNSALREKMFKGGYRKYSKLPAMGVTGKIVELDMTIIDELAIGPVILHDVPMAFADVPPFALFGLSDEPALLLGTDILEAFRKISLDFRARKVRFHLRRCNPSQGIVIKMVDTVSMVPMRRINPAQGCID
jgi:predicted aspartyl protease